MPSDETYRTIAKLADAIKDDDGLSLFLHLPSSFSIIKLSYSIALISILS